MKVHTNWRRAYHELYWECRERYETARREGTAMRVETVDRKIRWASDLTDRQIIDLAWREAEAACNEAIRSARSREGHRDHGIELYSDEGT